MSNSGVQPGQSVPASSLNVITTGTTQPSSPQVGWVYSSSLGPRYWSGSSFLDLTRAYTQAHGSYSVHGAIINVPPEFYVSLSNILTIKAQESWLLDFMFFGPADPNAYNGGPRIFLYNSPNSSLPVYEHSLAIIVNSFQAWTCHQRILLGAVYGNASKRSASVERVLMDANASIGTVYNYTMAHFVGDGGEPGGALSNLHMRITGTSVNSDVYVSFTRLI